MLLASSPIRTPCARHREIELARSMRARSRLGRLERPHKTVQTCSKKELVVAPSAGLIGKPRRLYNRCSKTKFRSSPLQQHRQIALAIERGEVAGIGDCPGSSVKVMRPDGCGQKVSRSCKAGCARSRARRCPTHSILSRIPPTAGARTLLHAEDRGTPVIAPPGVPRSHRDPCARRSPRSATDREFLAEASAAGSKSSPCPAKEVARSSPHRRHAGELSQDSSRLRAAGSR